MGYWNAECDTNSIHLHLVSLTLFGCLASDCKIVIKVWKCLDRHLSLSRPVVPLLSLPDVLVVWNDLITKDDYYDEADDIV